MDWLVEENGVNPVFFGKKSGILGLPGLAPLRKKERGKSNAPGGVNSS
jgi:hypothetical protein